MGQPPGQVSRGPADGRDKRQRARLLLDAHDEFLATGHVAAPVRHLVLDSWKRSLQAGVDSEARQAVLRLDADQLDQLRAEHPLATAMPLIRHLLLDSGTDAGLLVALSDAAGRLLWVEGSHRLRSAAEGVHFVAGADWSEGAVGTNAPGTALALDQPVQIFGAEHLTRPVTPWSCSAAPIHDPDTGAVLGVLDLTGGDEVISPQSLSLVRATVAAVESELRLDRFRSGAAGRVTGRSGGPGATRGRAGPLSLEVLGGHRAVLAHGASVRRLGLRHSEILLLLANAPDGLTASELAAGLSDHDGPGVTIRAEMARLRAVLAPLTLLSRPYRFPEPVHTDVDEVKAAMELGEYRRAVAAYRGPVLPASEAPAVAELREDLHARLRAGLLRSADPDAMLCFADTEYGRDDLAVWAMALDALPLDSPRRPQVQSHLDRLVAELG
ncbi:MAG: GAF domain-containing protein [Propionibacteriaceae bacterium]